MGIKNREHRTQFKDVSLTLEVTAGVDPDTTGGAPLYAALPGYTVYVQRIRVHIVTAAAKYWQFQNSANPTPAILAKLPASAAVGDVHTILDDEEGVPVGENLDLDIKTDGAGVAGRIVIEAYRKLTGVIIPSQIK